MYPKIIENEEAIILYLDESQENIIFVEDINFSIDLGKKNGVFIGLEILDVESQIWEKAKVRTHIKDESGETNEFKWKVTYDPEIDAVYFDLDREGKKDLMTRHSSGKMSITEQGKIISIIIDNDFNRKYEKLNNYHIY